MNGTNLSQWLRSNWYLPLLVVGIVGAILIGRYFPGIDDGTPPGTAQGESNDQSSLKRQFEKAKAQSDAREAEASERLSIDTIISEHTKKLEEEPPPDESAALLSALGNLYKQKKQDYAAAARYYEIVIEKYPDWPGIRGVYHQLMTCYSNLEDQTSLRLLYRKMMEFFPEESNEYQFAKDALGQ